MGSLLKVAAAAAAVMAAASTDALAQTGATVRTVSTGAAFRMDGALEAGRPTIFLFYQASSSADKAVVEDLKQKVATLPGRVGLRLVRLDSVKAPAAEQYGVSETPTLMLLDRFGKLRKRTSSIQDLSPAVGQAVKMARIKWVDEDSPEAVKTYGRTPAGFRAPEIMKTMSLRPELMHGIRQIAGIGHFSDGFLNRKTKEVIATYVSTLNRCKY
jgi:hypothetical protein